MTAVLTLIALFLAAIVYGGMALTLAILEGLNEDILPPATFGDPGEVFEETKP